MRAFLLLTAGLLALVAASPASAQRLEPLSFEIDVHNGPVLGSSRMIGLGGAYSAVATGIGGVAWNPASYASREFWETDWLAWDMAIGMLIPSTYSGSDYDNNGDNTAAYDGFLYGDFGLGFQLGALGFGFLLRSFTYDVQVDARAVSVGLLTGSYGGGYGFWGGQIVVGGGARTAQLDVSEGVSLLSLAGTAPEVGTLLRIAGEPWRLGAAFRAGLTVDNDQGGGVTGGLALPRAAHLPWELQVGFAYQFGDRPLNRRFVDPTGAENSLATHHRRRRAERANAQLVRESLQSGAPTPVGTRPADPQWRAVEARRAVTEDLWLEHDLEALELTRAHELRRLSRRYVMISGEVVVTGPTSDGVGLEGFLRAQRDISGQDVTASVRLGVEFEPWVERLKLRFGSYYEPSRFVDGHGRMHATAGFDLHVVDWDVFGIVDKTAWRITMVADIANRYFDWGIGLGVWH